MNEEKLTVLIVDDDCDFIEDFKILLPSGMTCLIAAEAEQAYENLKNNHVDVVFLDIDLGRDTDGLDILKQLKSECPYLPVIMVTADQNVATVVEAMRLGASDYIGKNPNLDNLKISINRAVSENNLKRRIEVLESELDSLVGDLIGESTAMKAVREEMARLARVRSNVLITGQSGTGKELVARGIHKLSANNGQSFIAVNCAALSRELFESELFGHEKGSFTGAVNRRIGKFELVGEGTLFLDEITEIPLELQAKLLRVLQEREFERVGGNRLQPFKGRLLASSNRDLDTAVKEQHLRQDLYYRLNVTRVHLPPLADRKEDIPLLAEHLVRIKADEMKKKLIGVSPDALELLTAYNWPGNVRELANRVENAVVYCDDSRLEAKHFRQLSAQVEAGFESYEEAKKHYLLKFQRDYISAMLASTGGNLSRTAEKMGVTRQGLSKMMKACGLN